MKKVLFATTALALTAGMAAADVSLSGYAEIGVRDDGTNTRFHHDFDVKFTLAGETDGGLAFGATIDLDEVSNGISNDANPSSVFVSGDFGTITMGDTDGAFDWAMTEVGFGTSIADDHTTHAGFNGNGGLDGTNDGQVARYDYSFGDFAFAVSAELDDIGTNDDVFGVGVKWSGDFGGTSLGIGIGFQDGGMIAGEDADVAGISIAADFAGGFSARLNYSEGNFATAGGVGDDEHIGVGVAYAMDNFIVEANYGEYEWDNGTAEADGYGIAFNYDLGGGAVVMVGYGNGGVAGTPDVDTWSAGLGLSF